MAEAFKIPPDFEFAWDAEPGYAGETPIRHRVSGKLGLVARYVGPTNQAEINYLVHKIRYEYRRDRLYLAVGRNIDRFRECQIEMRNRGYRM